MLKKIKDNIWVSLAMGGIVLSLLSLLLPVIRYTDKNAVLHRYSLITVLRDMDGFVRTVFGDYRGDFLFGLPYSTISLLTIIVAALGVGAIVLSFVGLISLSQQYTNRKSYILSICGLVGTAIPAIIILVLVLLSRNYFVGTIRCGLYEFITPVTMVLSCRAVTYKHKASIEQLRAAEKAQQYVYNPKSF